MSSPLSLKSASLARAYAALRHLDELKANDIRNPLPYVPRHGHGHSHGHDASLSTVMPDADAADSFAADSVVAAAGAHHGRPAPKAADVHAQPPAEVAPRGESVQSLALEIEEEEEEAAGRPSGLATAPVAEPSRAAAAMAIHNARRDRDAPSAGDVPTRLLRHTHSSSQKQLGRIVHDAVPPPPRKAAPSPPRVPAAAGRQGQFSEGIVGGSAGGTTPDSPRSQVQSRAYSPLQRGQAPPASPRGHGGGQGGSTTSLLSRMLEELVHLRAETHSTMREVAALRGASPHAPRTPPARSDPAPQRDASPRPPTQGDTERPKGPRKVFPKMPFNLSLKDAASPAHSPADVDVPAVRTKPMGERPPWSLSDRPSSVLRPTAASMARRDQTLTERVMLEQQRAETEGDGPPRPREATPQAQPLQSPRETNTSRLRVALAERRVEADGIVVPPVAPPTGSYTAAMLQRRRQPSEKGPAEGAGIPKVVAAPAMRNATKTPSPPRRVAPAPTPAGSSAASPVGSLRNRHAHHHSPDQRVLPQQRPSPSAQRSGTAATPDASAIVRLVADNAHELSVSPLTEPRASAEPMSPRGAVVPVGLAEYLAVLTGGDRRLVTEELAAMAALPPSSDPAREGRHWLAVSVLLNLPAVRAAIVVPLLTAELQGAQGPRRQQLICALMGMGPDAQAALPLLVHALNTTPQLDTLLAAAIRAVGRAEGVLALARAAREGSGPVQATALCGLAVMPTPCIARTSVCALGVSGLRGKMTFLQPAQRDEPRAGTSPEAPPNPLERAPPIEGLALRLPPVLYRTTLVFMDFNSAVANLRALCGQGGLPRAPAFDPSVCIRDFLCFAPPVVERLLADSLGPARAALAARDGPLGQLDVADVAAAMPFVMLAPSDGPPSVLQGSDWRSLLAEQGVATAAAGAIAACARGVSDDYGRELLSAAVVLLPTPITQSVHRDILQAATNALSGPPTTAAALLLATSAMAREHAECAAGASSLFATAARHREWQVRTAACVGFGLLGIRAADGGAECARRAVSALGDGSVGAAAAAWAMARAGPHGAGLLVDLLQQRHLSAAARVDVARALGDVNVLEAAGSSEGAQEAAAIVTAALLRVVDEAKEGDGPAALGAEALLALGRLLAGFTESGPAIEATAYFRDVAVSPVVTTIAPVVAEAPGTIDERLLLAATTSLALYGGPHAEVLLSQWALQSEWCNVRAAAAQSLRHRGPCTVRVLASALADPHPTVRAEAAASLEFIGVEPIVGLLRRRPADHAAQVSEALTEALGTQHLPSPFLSLLLKHLQGGK